MRFLYSDWDDDLHRRLRMMSDLMDIYSYLLLRMNGNVKLGLKLLRQLQHKGVLDAAYDIDEFEERLREAKLIRQTEKGPKLSAGGERLLRKDAFDALFDKLRRGGRGTHPIGREGGGSNELLPEKRGFRFGDDVNQIDFTASLFNSVKRTADLGLNMSENDLEVYETEQTGSSATVLLIDISHSMILYGEDRITPAKQVALAFTELILTKYPRDFLSIVVFGDDAWEVKVADLPYLTVGPYHTNTQAGLRAARKILRGQKHANKQIFMITDGKPTLITRPNGQIYRNSMGLDPRIINRTLDEAVVCRKKKIPITTFMVTDDPHLQQFVARLTELNRGRAYFSSVDNLGSFVFWDFVSHKRRRR